VRRYFFWLSAFCLYWLMCVTFVFRGPARLVYAESVCLAPSGWLPTTPLPTNETPPPHPAPDCPFYKAAWQTFLYVTQPSSDGRPRFLSYSTVADLFGANAVPQCALPAHQLPNINWGKTDLPQDQRDAARQLQYARITKTAVLCSERFWPRPRSGGFFLFTTLASDFCFDSTAGQKGNNGILCSYAIGDKADDIAASPLHSLKNWIVGDVANAARLGWPDKRVKKTALTAKRQAWQDENFTRGAYAFYRPGQWFTLRPILQKPHRKVFFAGEHIADEQGFMEGAVVTGRDAADSL
jgi:hypothetical protein